jgi:endo-1,4-beta-D-glucanase Y
MSAIEGIKNLSSMLPEDYMGAKKTKNENSGKKDTIEISNTSKAFAKIDNFLNLGRSDRLDTSDLNDSEKEEFVKMLAALMKKGVVGYEMIEVNGKPEKHYIVNEIGDQRLYGKKLYNRFGYKKDEN